MLHILILLPLLCTICTITERQLDDLEYWDSHHNPTPIKRSYLAPFLSYDGVLVKILFSTEGNIL